MGRNEATARGTFFTVIEALKNFKLPKIGDVVIQGFGNAGAIAAKLFDDAGFTIVGVSDSKGGIYNQYGFYVNDVIKFKKVSMGTAAYIHAGKRLVEAGQLRG